MFAQDTAIKINIYLWNMNLKFWVRTHFMSNTQDWMVIFLVTNQNLAKFQCCPTVWHKFIFGFFPLDVLGKKHALKRKDLDVRCTYFQDSHSHKYFLSRTESWSKLPWFISIASSKPDFVVLDTDTECYTQNEVCKKLYSLEVTYAHLNICRYQRTFWNYTSL